MSQGIHLTGLKVLLGLAVLSVAGGANAQLPRQPVSASVDRVAVSDGSSFRDPKTGHVWTPDNVGEDGKPLDPKDRAFDPNGQVTLSGGVIEQRARIRYVGRVPMTAGPTVPLVEIDSPSLRVRPGKHWLAVIYLQNNSLATLAPTIGCRFSNADKLVEETLVLVPPTAGGDRIALSFQGPPSEIFVDFVACFVGSP